MTDDQGIVAEALDQCMAELERGFNSHGSPVPTVAAGIVDKLRAGLVVYFHRNLVTNKRPWHGSKGDCWQVTRMAYYVGAIAAFHAAADPAAQDHITQAHLTAAFSYAKQHCQHPQDPRIRWIYCT